MSLWWTTRRWWLAGGALGLFLLSVELIGEYRATVPAFTPIGSATIKLMLFVPVPVCLALAYCAQRFPPSPESTAVRPVGVYDGFAVVVLGSLAVAGVALIDALGTSPLAWAAGRNLLFLIGLTMTVGAMAGSTVSGVACVGWLVLVTLVGYGNDLHPYPWTVVLRDATDPVAGIATGVVFALGVAATMGRHSPLPGYTGYTGWR
ncbi:hypothetical protein GCM10027160_19260 [Streptomyces calidiresistens]|uniref:Uncharacterized protein n=1 Tax=Streptomyces calidiresistens TaxID=1485586 RepID=A0A7W3T4Q1_9ACTN|nr:hypothetical protein [Streptomyces calidiresistens]MBB0230746.1 hypothetical protein [Streptomyces calidiresistens]